tara:strand:- start:1473 stop:1691 length:219 start_codon:yes stop_codon:yes gene_type:complete
MFLFKRLLITISINSLLFLLLIIGIQNSLNKKTVNLLINKTIELPIGFIAGSSFLAGSLLGGILTSINLKDN